MVQYLENEIQVLGYKPKRKNHWKWIIPLIIVGVALILSFLFFTKDEEEGDIDLRTFKTELKAPSKEEGLFIESGVEYYDDVVNDVSLHVFHMIDMSAELSTDISQYTDSAECFIVQAADIRQDNGKFVGDYVLDGKVLSSGKRKKGHCAIIDGKLSIGMSEDDEVMNGCIVQGGSFFRQYALVADGIMQENELKGKSIRRALARKGNKYYVFETENRESMHDFAEALQDMGVTEAISLVDGDAYMYWSQDNEVYESYPLSEVKNPNYIVFKRKEKK